MAEINLEIGHVGPFPHWYILGWGIFREVNFQGHIFKKEKKIVCALSNKNICVGCFRFFFRSVILFILV